MNKNRDMVKWLPFNSLINNKTVVEKVLKEKAKTKMPVLSEDEIKDLEDKILNAYYKKEPVKITYYKNGYFYEEISEIKKIDSSNKLIYLNNTKLIFNQIVGVIDTK